MLTRKENNIRIIFIAIIIIWNVIYTITKINVWIFTGVSIAIILSAYIWLYRIEKEKNKRHYDELVSRWSRINKDLLNKKS